MSSSIAQRVDAYIHRQMADQQIPGLSLAVVDDGELRLARGYGQANLELAAPATADTVYEIASVTKLFTATAVMMLVEAGRVDLAGPVADYLPDLPAAWRPVTVRHILAHQSGLPSYTAVPEYWPTTRLDVGREAILGLVAERPLTTPPGERYAYDNTGFYLLGLLIEAVTGLDYGTFLAQRILEPLGMDATRPNDPYAIVPGRAAGYTAENGVIRNAPYYSPSGTFSAGVLLSSAADLARWAATLYSDRLLNEASRQLVWTPHPSRQGNERSLGFTVGLGWFLVTGMGRPFAGHNGGIVGFASSFSHFLTERLTVIALYNVDTVEPPHTIPHEIAAYYWT